MSNISKINMASRVKIPLEDIHVIPNGIIPGSFFPKKKQMRGACLEKEGKRVRILFCGRLVFRKGIELLAKALPLICSDQKNEVLIVGDGPKQDIIQQMIDEAELHNQVTMLGNIDYLKVPEVMRKCDIFLSTSLTETFCTSILEAASCGLLVVSTNVGGIHEVLEKGLIYFCKPTPEDIASQVANAVKDLNNHDPEAYYPSILRRYDWRIVTRKTFSLYTSIPDKIGPSKIADGREKNVENFIYRFGTWFETVQIWLFQFLERLLYE